MKYKAIMLDVDGTILNGDFASLPSEKVTKAIKKAHKKVQVCLATGRPQFHVEHILDHLGLDGPCIINDGAQIIDAKSKEILHEVYMHDESFSKIVKLLRKKNVSFIVHDNGKDYFWTDTFMPHKPFNIFTKGVREDHLAHLLMQIADIPHIATHKYYNWETGGFDVLASHAEATKQYGILKVAESLGIQTHQIIGVGDGYNDFPMMMACGLKVAMGNAVSDLKEIADHIAPHVDDDGVADVIEKFILKPSKS